MENFNEKITDKQVLSIRNWKRLPCGHRRGWYDAELGNCVICFQPHCEDWPQCHDEWCHGVECSCARCDSEEIHEPEN
jgi:hypothetical protein